MRDRVLRVLEAVAGLPATAFGWLIAHRVKLPKKPPKQR